MAHRRALKQHPDVAGRSESSGQDPSGAIHQTAKPAEVEQYLHVLRLIGRDALTAGLKDVLRRSDRK